MFCSNCGTELIAGEDSCPHCFQAAPKRGLLRQLFRFLFGKVAVGVLPTKTQIRVVKTGRVFKSLKELPPELLAQLPAEAQKSFAHLGDLSAISKGVAIEEEKVSHSLNDVPPELRAKLIGELERALKEGGSESSVTFTYQGPDGSKRTYHSTEEMPADVRAIFESVDKGQFGEKLKKIENEDGPAA